MFDYLGLIISGLSTFFFSTKDPWQRKWKFLKIRFGHIGIFFLILGIIISIITIYLNDKEKADYKNQINNIDTNVRNTLNTTSKGYEKLLKEYEVKTNILLKNFSSNYDTLMKTIINKNDSALYAQLKKIKKDYSELDNKLSIEKSITQRYYYSEQWPVSDNKIKDICYCLLYFIPRDIAGLLTGTDRYILWKIIEKNGVFPNEQIDILDDEIWEKLKPMSLSIEINLNRLALLKVIKPDFWKNDIEFTDYYKKRLSVYNEYKKDKNEVKYIKDLFKLQLENYYWNDNKL